MKTYVQSSALECNRAVSEFRRPPLSTSLLLMILVASVSLSGCVSTAGLSMSASHLSFGNVAIGSTSKKNLTVTNSATAAVTITQTILSGKAFSIEGPPLPLTLASGQSATFMTTFAPTAKGDISGSISITRVQANPAQLAAEGISASPSSSTRQTMIALDGAGVATAPPVTITVNPGQATVAAGSTQQFVGNVTGSTNAAVTWSVSSAGCAGEACGIISPSGLYTSPSSVPSPAVVTVKATSAADSTKSISANVTIVAAVAVLLSISPASATVPTSGTQLFNASVTGTSNTAVTWNLSGAGCSGSACGTLANTSTTALYSAPAVAPIQPTVTVTATSVAAPTNFAVASVDIAPNILVAVTPANVSVSAGATQQFSAAVTGASNTAVSWNVTGSGCSEAACGTIDANGLYTAPGTYPTPAAVTVTAISAADPTKSGSVNLTLSAPSSVTVSVLPNGSTKAPFAPLLLLPGGVKRVYANVCNGANVLDCARPSDITVNWQASCGALSSGAGPYVDYTAPSSGGPCTITATNPPSGVSATATATLANAKVSVDVIPAALVLYQGQYALLQAVVTGSVNRDVTWALTSNPGNGGTLIPQGWTSTFSGSAPGAYSVTATSKADNTQVAVITLYVTANPMPATARVNKTEPVDCTPVGSGSDYRVGPSQTNKTINSVPWNSLKPGDTVRIFNEGPAGNPTTYAEKWLIKQSGTATQPIRVCGVANANGELPVVDGNGAATGASLDYGIIQDRAPVIIYDRAAAWGNGATYPKYITIEGLKIVNEKSSLNFVAQGGALTPWGAFGAAIWMQHGGHVTIRGNDLEGDQQSLFINAQSPESAMSRWLLVQGNYIANNGIVGGFGSHQLYVQAFGQVIQGNYLGEPLAGMAGSQVKERCVECFTRYNYIAATVAGARIFDIVAPEGSICLTMVQQYYAQGGAYCGNSPDAVAAAEDWYGTDYVYGNIVKFSQAAQPIHYGNDNCAETAHGGTLYLYQNTFWEAGEINWRWNIFDTGPGGVPCQATTPVTGYPGGRYANNAFKLSPANNATKPYFLWTSVYSSFLQLDTNWITSSWGSGVGQGVDGDGTAWGMDSAEYQTGNDSHHITGIGNLISGSGAPFDSSTYIPTANSPLIGAAGPLPAAVSSALPVTMQYNPNTFLMSPRTATADIGAIGH